MKSKKKQRLLALILSMVLMLSASISALAEGDVQTEASGTETTENQAAVQSLEQETVPETEVTTEEGGIDTQAAETSTEPVQENTEQEVTETPAEPEQGVTEETAETTDTTQSQAQSTEVQEESDAAEEIPVEEQPGETTEETATEETVVSEAAELKQEFTDENGNALLGGYTPLVEWYEYPEPAPAEKTGQEAWDAVNAVVESLQEAGIDVSMPE